MTSFRLWFVSLSTIDHLLVLLRLSVCPLLQFYLQTKLVWRGSKLLRHFLQFAAAYMALYTCASRVSDYKHHWSDVLGGAVLGTIVAVLTVRHTANSRN